MTTQEKRSIKEKVLQLVYQRRFAEVFGLLERYEFDNYSINALRREYITGSVDTHFGERLQILIRDIFEDDNHMEMERLLHELSYKYIYIRLNSRRYALVIFSIFIALCTVGYILYSQYVTSWRIRQSNEIKDELGKLKNVVGFRVLYVEGEDSLRVVRLTKEITQNIANLKEQAKAQNYTYQTVREQENTLEKRRQDDKELKESIVGKGYSYNKGLNNLKKLKEAINQKTKQIITEEATLTFLENVLSASSNRIPLDSLNKLQTFKEKQTLGIFQKIGEINNLKDQLLEEEIRLIRYQLFEETYKNSDEQQSLEKELSKKRKELSKRRKQEMSILQKK